MVVLCGRCLRADQEGWRSYSDRRNVRPQFRRFFYWLKLSHSILLPPTIPPSLDLAMGDLSLTFSVVDPPESDQHGWGSEQASRQIIREAVGVSSICLALISMLAQRKQTDLHSRVFFCTTYNRSMCYWSWSLSLSIENVSV